MHSLKRVLFASFLLIVAAASVPGQTRDPITAPDVGSYKTLKCDFHMHTVFSDGEAWPTARMMSLQNCRSSSFGSWKTRTWLSSAPSTRSIGSVMGLRLLDSKIGSQPPSETGPTAILVGFVSIVPGIQCRAGLDLEARGDG